MTKLQPVVRKNNYQVATQDNLLLLWWTDVASADVVTALRPALERIRASKKKILFLTYLEERALSTTTPADFRNDFAKLLMEFDKDIGAGSIVLEKSGLKGAIVRGIVSTIALASKTSYPAGVHSTLSEGVDWMLKKAGEPTSSSGNLVWAVQTYKAENSLQLATG